MKKSKPKPFRASKAVKAAARSVLGSPKPSQVQPGTPKRATDPKHKATLTRLLSEE